jgi:hypothetical protein
MLACWLLPFLHGLRRLSEPDPAAISTHARLRIIMISKLYRAMATACRSGA